MRNLFLGTFNTPSFVLAGCFEKDGASSRKKTACSFAMLIETSPFPSAMNDIHCSSKQGSMEIEQKNAAKRQ